MSKLTRANKIDQMSTAEWQQYHQLMTNQQLMKYFADEVLRFSRSPMKPDDVLRRFSLNGDGHLDLREFQLAVTRLEIVSTPPVEADGSYEKSQHERDLARAKELYLVFCPSQTRKLDIDLFCRVMTEWSLQPMRARYQQDQTALLASSMSSMSMGNRIQYSTPRVALPTPYATQTSLEISRAVSGENKSKGESERIAEASARNARFLEGEVLWQRLSTAITQSSEKLRLIFLKMDVMSSGRVSPEELELALSHIGVFLTTREYEKLYMSMGDNVKEYKQDGASNGWWRGRGGNGKAFVIKYAEFLALFQEKTERDPHVEALPSNSRQVSPPVVGVGTARLWDLLVAAIDKLKPLFQQYERIRQYYMPPETFRDCLLRCGITMSNADFAALRVRLLPFTDSASGAIGLPQLLEALKASDRTTMQSKASPSVPGGSIGYVGVSPIRLGRKTVAPISTSVPKNDLTPYPAGKSTHERNAEENRTIVKIRDERRRESDIHFPLKTGAPGADERADGGSEAYLEHQHRRQDPFFSTGLLARYAEVEALFWALDPHGSGYVRAQDFYDHLNSFSTQLSNQGPSKYLPELTVGGSPHGGRLPRSVQKVLERMYLDLPKLCAICERMDTNQTGTVSSTELLSAIHEMGIMASVADKHAALQILNRDEHSKEDNTPSERISYRTLEGRLAAICSVLLSPKKCSKHLTNTSVLLAPYEEYSLPEHTTSNKPASRDSDALWNCPRRRMHQDHRAARSSIKITDAVSSPEGREFTPTRPPSAAEEAKLRRDRRHRVALVGVLQDLLERRCDLKTALDLHRRADARGLVTKHDLVEILLTSRLNLHFPAGAPAAQELVDELYPTLGADSSLGFLDILRRISELLGEVTTELSLSPPSSGNGPPSTFSTNPYQPPRQTGRRHNGANFDMHSSPLPMKPSPSASIIKSSAIDTALSDSATTVRRKLLHDSRLKDLLNSDYGLQSAAVLVRHAFKGLAPREMVVPVDNGEFEAMCRVTDVKHVCYRLGLDLDLYEQQFVASSVDAGDSGFVTSPDLLEFFKQLAQTVDVASPSTEIKQKHNDVDVRRSVTFREPVGGDDNCHEHTRAIQPSPVVH
ncbi:hypothetical protein PHYBOEH_011019 [Phytophthora boehmeriae]|uniref:EF-hand domain-containing protein n=1 Tax=Phytophthora boehmeriae TaxID=109152 RepID=A0A8T1XEE1_9STRA|nr:hypothetical protein PHYBOEH_011019 [Phytophthora boehmeriae]